MDVAVGGTNGWFPDNAGNKPWLNAAQGSSSKNSKPDWHLANLDF